MARVKITNVKGCHITSYLEISPKKSTRAHVKFKMKGNLLESEYIIRSAVDTTEKINYFKSQKYSRRLRAKVIQYLKKVMYGCKGQSIATH